MSGTDTYNSSQISPARPFTCPVCNGHGLVMRPPWIAGDQATWEGAAAHTMYDCRACKGTGLVWK